MATHTHEKLIVNQGAADDAALQLKSSDVAHGMTTLAETDTYYDVTKRDANTGGVQLRGFSEAGVGMQVVGAITTAESVRSTAARGAVILDGQLKSGTSSTSLGANTNIVTVSDNGTTRFILDSDGDSHQDVGTAWTNFDICHDVEMLNVLSAFATRPNDPLRANFQRWLTVPENRDRLEALGLVTFNDGPDGDGSVFVNMSKLAMLLVGAVRQMHDRFSALESQVARLLPASA